MDHVCCPGALFISEDIKTDTLAFALNHIKKAVERIASQYMQLSRSEKAGKKLSFMLH